MGNKGKQKASKDPVKKQSPVIWVVAGVIAIVAVLAFTGNLPFTGSEAEAGKSFNLKGKETRPLLDPALFTGQTRRAYEVAHNYSEYLDEVFCYCYCDRDPFNHFTLLSCFADRHGAG